jgi:tetratricopeptide (TPR) repeat protein
VAVAHAQQDRYEQSKRYLEQSLDVCRQTGHRRDEGWALQYLGFVHALLGNYGAGRAYSEQALRVHQETGDRYAEMQVYQDLVRVAAHTDDYAKMMGWIAEAEQRQVEHLDWAIYAGDLAWKEGERESARAQYQAVMQATGEEGFKTHLARCGLASIALAEGDQAAAERWIDAVLPLLGQPVWWSPLVGLYPHLVCYRVLRAGSDPRASEILNKAYRLLQERASWIEDEALRRSYLENVPANREVAALYRAASNVRQ